jgi:hypothetical protein
VPVSVWRRRRGVMYWGPGCGHIGRRRGPGGPHERRKVRGRGRQGVPASRRGWQWGRKRGRGRCG